MTLGALAILLVGVALLGWGAWRLQRFARKRGIRLLPVLGRVVFGGLGAAAAACGLIYALAHLALWDEAVQLRGAQADVLARAPAGQGVALARADGRVALANASVRGHAAPVTAVIALQGGLLSSDAAGEVRLSQPPQPGLEAPHGAGEWLRQAVWAPLGRPVARWSLGVAAQGAALSIPEEARGQAVRVFRDCADCPEMVELTGGAFLMGSAWFEENNLGDERPRRLVRVPPFAVGRFEVTFEEYDACVASGGCNGYRPEDEGWGRGTRPVIKVSWEDAQAYVAWLSRKTGQRYRLLSEAEWEYAARAGTTGRFSNDGGDAQLCQIANHSDQSTDYSWRNSTCNDGVGEQTAPVGRYAANPFGLHDMHGNVWEWVEDCYQDSYSKAPANGVAAATSNCADRVYRGGSWGNYPRFLRSAYRVRNTPTYRDDVLGFRLARTN